MAQTKQYTVEVEVTVKPGKVKKHTFKTSPASVKKFNEISKRADKNENVDWDSSSIFRKWMELSQNTFDSEMHIRELVIQS